MVPLKPRPGGGWGRRGEAREEEDTRRLGGGGRPERDRCPGGGRLHEEDQQGHALLGRALAGSSLKCLTNDSARSAEITLHIETLVKFQKYIYLKIIQKYTLFQIFYRSILQPTTLMTGVLNGNQRVLLQKKGKSKLRRITFFLNSTFSSLFKNSKGAFIGLQKSHRCFW
jgi:hypothetical protein